MGTKQLQSSHKYIYLKNYKSELIEESREILKTNMSKFLILSIQKKDFSMKLNKTLQKWFVLKQYRRHYVCM